MTRSLTFSQHHQTKRVNEDLEPIGGKMNRTIKRLQIFVSQDLVFKELLKISTIHQTIDTKHP